MDTSDVTVSQDDSGPPPGDPVSYGRSRPGCGPGCGITALVVIAFLIVGLSSGGSLGNSLSAPGIGTTTTPATSSAPRSPADPLAGAVAGSCYANNGTENDPQWQLAPGCQSGDFKVVAVESGTTDFSSACSAVPDWDIDFPDLVDDQVLCMAYLDASSAYDADINQCVFGPSDSDQGWHVTPCDAGTFAVVNVYRNSTDPHQCGSARSVPFTVPGYPNLAKVLCVRMIFPWISTVLPYTCAWESGSGTDTNFTPVTSCGYANAMVELITFTPNDRSSCSQHGWWPYTWHSDEYPDLGITVCLGSP